MRWHGHNAQDAVEFALTGTLISRPEHHGEHERAEIASLRHMAGALTLVIDAVDQS
jgi:hypothetical protein